MVKRIGYALGVIGEQEVWVGGLLSNIDRPSEVDPWPKIGVELPTAGEFEFGGSVSMGYEIEPGEEKTIRFVAAGYAAPKWIGETDCCPKVLPACPSSSPRPGRGH